MGDAELKGKDQSGKRKERLKTDGDIRIRWRNGEMAVHLDAFFPANASQVRKLLKVIRLDGGNGEETVKQMLDFLEKRNEAGEEAMELQAQSYLIHKQLYTECKEMAASRRHPNGVPLTKEGWALARTQRDGHKRAASACAREVKRLQSWVKRTEENIRLIKKVWGGRG